MPITPTQNFPAPDAQFSGRSNNEAQDDKVTAMTAGILSLPPVWREILIRYYGEGQSLQEICTQMRITETKFREIKSVAKQLLDGTQG